MSKKRSISFSENELDLMDYFDKNGKSNIAKTALRFHRDNKDNVINEGTVKLIQAINIQRSTTS